MNINWVVSNHANLDPTIDLSQIKNIGSIWGSWRTWRSCQTDNVICHNGTQARELIEKRFPDVCNFYISQEIYTALNRPDRVRSYGGEFSHDVDEQDEIVAMHLAGAVSDIVLLLGFDWTDQPWPNDPEKKLRRHNYINLVREAMAGTARTQWVLIDHAGPIRPELAALPNLTQDTMSAVIGMLSP